MGKATPGTPVGTLGAMWDSASGLSSVSTLPEAAVMTASSVWPPSKSVDANATMKPTGQAEIFWSTCSCVAPASAVAVSCTQEGVAAPPGMPYRLSCPPTAASVLHTLDVVNMDCLSKIPFQRGVLPEADVCDVRHTVVDAGSQVDQRLLTTIAMPDQQQTNCISISTFEAYLKCLSEVPMVKLP